MQGRFALLAAALCLSACASIPAKDEAGVAAIMAAGDTRPAAIPAPKTEQWLYGSAEAQVAMRQGWDSIATYGEYVAQNRPSDSVFMVPVERKGGGPNYHFDGCGAKPLAAVFDADETVIWNLGVTRYQSERGKGYDPQIWDAWELTGADKVVAVPGAVAAFDRLRAAGLTIIINTNREAKNAAQTADALRHAGLGEFQHGTTLYLKGDGVPAGREASSFKDSRRRIIAENYCIVILAGDQLGDISDMFNTQRYPTTTRHGFVNNPDFDHLWGKGWFILPNPVYGPWEGASFDDIYPADTRWTPTNEGK